MNNLIKKLTSKNQADYIEAARHIISNADIDAFKELVNQDDFLFDFVKNNVAKRLKQACTKDNFKNLLKFLEFYSPYYDEFISDVLSQFSDEEVHNVMKNKLFNGTQNEQSYSAKYFEFKPDTETLDKLRELSYSEFEPLAINSAKALSAIKDRECINSALNKLKSNDDYEILLGTKFLSAYGEKNNISEMFNAMKKSSFSEYIAQEIGYLEDFSILLNNPAYHNNTLLAIMHILSGLGEIIPISSVFTFNLYEIFEKLIFSEPNSKNAVLLLYAKNKFNQLTENDEYLFDEDKNTKEEVNFIKTLLNDNTDDDLEKFITPELEETSEFVEFALDMTTDINAIRKLLNSKNQTIILKSLEVLKYLNKLSEEDKTYALKHITNDSIKSIVDAL